MTSPRENVLCQYHYDPLDRLTSHALTNTPERQRFYCKSRLATEIQGLMRFSIVQHGDQLLAQQRGEGDTSDSTMLAIDQQRSVLQALKANHPPQPIGYSPYGHRPVESGLLSLLGFNGERPDPVTGCYLLGNGYRAFNPALMRFNSPDSLSPFGRGGLNAYAYCAGEPVLGSDPTGHWTIASAWKGLKSLFGRTPRKLSTSTPAAAQRTADLANAPASSNTARKFSSNSNSNSNSNSSSSSSQRDHPMEYKTPRAKLNSDMFEPRHSESPKSSLASINSDSPSSFPAADGRRPSLDSISSTSSTSYTRQEQHTGQLSTFVLGESTNNAYVKILRALHRTNKSPEGRARLANKIRYIRGKNGDDILTNSDFFRRA
ncbi:hypothetical protein PS914_02072 [Pseudomonas fluorescens]|uniref:RHS repeat-associated core domain-containing protein n=1 Tax=Pseudomonas fluorescens TaxID=294 RepID=UPI001240EA77|nr:RHS repeat-associated core domain-containing protein [Pseudomonas fluorescens]VVP79565.1 hypothetical protein PS914_02072 [Pseudomonas fluorescens]